MREERRPGKLKKQKSKKVRILLPCFTFFSFAPQLANRGHEIRTEGTLRTNGPKVLEWVRLGVPLRERRTW